MPRGPLRVMTGVLLIGAWLSSLPGCSWTNFMARETAEQQSAFDTGVAAIENADYGTAEREFTFAIERSLLLADQQEQGYLLRAKARMELGDFAGAEADLDWLDQRATNLDAVWIARGELLRKKGDDTGAAQAFQEARKINPRVAVPVAAK
jgi:tetratricopeptide (TPR) repeat protein